MRGGRQPITKTRSFDANLERAPERRMAGKAERDLASECCNALQPKRGGVVVDVDRHCVECRVKDSLVANALHHRIEGDVLDRYRAVRLGGIDRRGRPRHVRCVGEESTEGVRDALWIVRSAYACADADSKAVVHSCEARTWCRHWRRFPPRLLDLAS